MQDPLNMLGSWKPRFEPKSEQSARPQVKPAGGNSIKTPVGGADRISLEQPATTAQTYRPLPGVAVGAPYQLLRSLVIKTLEGQAVELQIDTGSEILELNKLTPEKARQLVSEDGYLGVEKTSQRIVDFAVNAFGNDPARLEEMTAAIEEGFQQAAGAFVGSLPEISHQTYTAIMEKLQAFAGLDEEIDQGLS